MAILQQLPDCSTIKLLKIVDKLLTGAILHIFVRKMSTSFNLANKEIKPQVELTNS